MSIKKLILISIGVVILASVVIGIITPDSKYSNNFKASYPEVLEPTNIPGFPTLSQVDVIVDFSGSMRGFIDYSGVNNGAVDNSNFISTVSDFLTEYESNFKAKSIVYCGTKKYGKDEFREGMRNKGIFHGGTTELDKLIEKTVSMASDTSVSVLLSDMVLSYGPNVIRTSKNPRYNKDALDGLSSAVKSCITKAKDKGLDIMLVQYLCDFSGQYYYNYLENLPSNRSDYNGALMKNRPYYFMLIGKKEYLVNLYDKCVKKAEYVYTSFDVAENPNGKKAFSIAEKKNKNGVNYWEQGTEETESPGTFVTKLDLEGEKNAFAVRYDNFILPTFINGCDIVVNTDFGHIEDMVYDANSKTLTYTYCLPNFEKLKNADNIASIDVMYNSSANKCDAISLDDDVNMELAKLEGKTWSVSAVVSAIDGVYYGKRGREACITVSRTKLIFKKI